MPEGMMMATDLRHHRFTVDEYERIDAAGVLPDGVLTELLEGDVVEMAPIGDRHAALTARIARLFFRRFDDLGVIVWPQNPVVMRPDSMPQPDVCLLRPRADCYESGKPVPADVLLVVEIAESSLAIDLGYKAALYARHGIVEYWVVDVASRSIEIFAAPRDDGFANRSRATAGRLATIAMPDRPIGLDEIFGSTGP